MDSIGSSTNTTGQPHPQLYLVDVHQQGGTWLEKLLLNLFSYSLVLVPIAVVVLSTRYRLCPGFLQSSALVQLFVNGSYGSSGSSSRQQATTTTSSQDSESLIIQDNGNKKSTRRTVAESQVVYSSKDVIKFLWCFSGLMISYLVWGILQEKIMTTKYTTSNSSIASNNNESTNVMIDYSNRTLVNGEAPAATFTFHDSQFLVFINRIIAFILALLALLYDRPKQSTRSRLVYSNAQGKHQVIQYRNLNKLTASNESISSTASTTKPSAPLYQFVYCSLSNILSSWCQYEALKYVNFPTQVLSKTFKMVPVMIMSKVMLHKKYKPVDYGCALALSLGMFVFLVNQPTSQHGSKLHQQHTNQQTIGGSNQNHWIGMSGSSQAGSSAMLSGLILLSLYLAFDSFTGNWQKSLFTRYHVTTWQMMAAVNLYSILLTLTSLYQLGNLTPALKMLANCRPLLFDCLFMSIMSSVGQFFVYYTINQFGPVMFTVIMTFRQLLAILISCALYGHQLSAGSSLGIVLVFMVAAFRLWLQSRGGKAKSSTQASASQLKFAPLASSSSR